MTITRAPGLEIVQLGPALQVALIDLFDEIRQSGDTVLFHPHPFTADEAARLCCAMGDDLYYALLVHDRILGYGMLRGWDAGYSVPSLGIIVRAEARGKGLGKLLMHHLHAAAQLRGAPRIRLKVYQQNDTARHMYEQLGYRFDEQEGEQLVGIFPLPGA